MASSSAVPLSPSLLAAPRRHARTRLALILVWLGLVAYLAAHHVFWRDEIRALELALSGNGLGGMLRAVHGEGHPALWYLLLRLAHDLVPVRAVLPAVGLAIGVAAGSFFAWRAPFHPFVIAVVLFSGWLTYEDTVMARNYGIATLLIFALADRFARGVRSGWVIGALLFVLANTNVPAVLIAGGFLLFWAAELVGQHGWRPGRAWRSWAIAAALAALGVIACFLEVYPPVNDAAVSPLGHGLTAARFVAMALNLSGPMSNLLPEWWWDVPAGALLLAVLLLASPLSLLRSPAGTIAAVAVLPAMTLFFQVVYPGAYRHQALYLAFLLALHWMVAAGRGGAWPEGYATVRGRIPALATSAFVALLTLQVATLALVVGGVAHGFVASRAADLGRLLHRPDLRRAVVIADPDAIVEALPYYADNPVYLVRERRFGHVSHFTNHAILHLTLADVLAAARRVQRATGRPVVIVTAPRFGDAWRDLIWREGYTGTFSATTDDVRRLHASTTLLASYAPATTDESYDVYLLNPASRP